MIFPYFHPVKQETIYFKMDFNGIVPYKPSILMGFFLINLSIKMDETSMFSEVRDLCDLIDHAPSAAVDLLDMLTTAPKERRNGGGTDSKG